MSSSLTFERPIPSLRRLRLLVRLVVRPEQRLRLADGATSVAALEGDLVLENAFRPSGSRAGACLLRRDLRAGGEDEDREAWGEGASREAIGEAGDRD